MRAARFAEPAGIGGRAAAPQATLALAALTATVAVGMGRLFTGGSYLLPLLAAVAVAHAAMWTGRRSALPLALGVPAAVGGMAVAAAWLLLPETTSYGIPGPATLDAARRALAHAWGLFGDVVAPAPATDGFVLAAMIGVGVTAVLADWAAFHMRVLFEAVVPSFTLFVFTATLGESEGRPTMVGLYLAALLLFLVVHRAALESEGAAWFASRTRGGAGALGRGAAGLGLVAVVAAVVIGPRLPGASADALLAWRDDEGAGGAGRRTTVSPLVDIRGRLVDQSTTEVFSVRTNQRAYWRLTSLDTFDGQIWSSDASYKPVGTRLPAPSTAGPRDRVVQRFTIRSLSSIWLPAAYRPETVQGIDDVSYNADLGSLITADDTTDGLTYTVESALPRLTAADLRAADGPVGTPAAMDRFLRLPRLSTRVEDQARLLRDRSDGTPYGIALALQAHFRDGFTYDLNVGGGHDEQALENFLFGTRRGYCEQFAGAFAVLARALGLPTRVAVGFTPGELGPDGELHVRGLNAHAWPEVFLVGAGWVPFEPTPGRGAPGAESYLGIPESQAPPDSPGTATTAVPTTVPQDDPSDPSTTAVPAGVAAGAAAEVDEARPLWRHPLVVMLIGAVLVVLVLAAAVPAAKAGRRRRRRSAATTAADRVWVAWTEAAGAVGRAGAPKQAAETLAEHARRAASATALADEAAAALATLASDAAAASYAGGTLPEDTAERAARHATVVERHLTGRASRRQRLLWTFDPRPLLPWSDRGPGGTG